MQKIDKLLVSLNEWIAKADTDDFVASLTTDLEVFDMLPGYVEEFEKEIAKLLRKQKKYLVEGQQSLSITEKLKDYYFAQNVLPTPPKVLEQSYHTQNLHTHLEQLSSIAN